MNQTGDTGRSGPAVAWLFHRLLALTFLIAWLSLAVQVQVLIGSRGLLPLAPLLKAGDTRGGYTIGQFPTVFWLDASDTVLTVGVWIGVALALAALAGILPRVCFALSTGLYLSYATGCRTFLGFQWDNLLLECGFLAVFLPTDRPARWVHILFRLLLFKLYWESGIAKWQSYLGDWQDGSAMTFYYETAPLPTWLAWFMHALPPWWHGVESHATLILELIVPLAIFGPRVARLTVFAIFTGFQILNAATANYGFFCYLSAVLNVFLLGDRDVVRMGARVRSWMPWRAAVTHPAPSRPPRHEPPWRAWMRAPLAFCVITLFVSVSIIEGAAAFAGPGAWRMTVEPLRAFYRPWRLVNTYHLFGHITQERIEPEFQTFDGHEWTTRHLRHKAGDPLRPPGFVAPHQPRVDFQLWFHGLGFQHRTPDYISALVERLCHDPAAVQSLFLEPLATRPEAVRIAYVQYHFTTPAEHRRTGTWWTRQPVGVTQPMRCDDTTQSRIGN